MEIYPFVSPSNFVRMSSWLVQLRTSRVYYSMRASKALVMEVLSKSLKFSLAVMKGLVKVCAVSLPMYLVGRYMWARLWKRYGRQIHTWLLSKSEVYPTTCQQLRSTFMNAPDMQHTPVKGHTHGMSASMRSAASTTIENYVALVGKRPYYVQMSSSDQKIGRTGSRTWYWSKDTHVEPKDDVREVGDVLVYIDVDQYIDMPGELCDEFRPVVVYTFQPDSVAKVAGDYSYTCNRDNEFTYRVTGGGKYEHRVWNYAHDSLLVYKSWFGIRYASAVYAVERRPFGPDHDIVLLAPIRRWGWISLLSYWIDGPVLEYLQPVVGDFLRLKVFSATGMMMSTGRVGEYNSATIPVTVDEGLAAIVRTTKCGLTLPSVQSVVEDRAQAAILHEYHSKQVKSEPPIVYPVHMAVRTYQIVDPRLSRADYEPEAKSSMQAFMSPIMHECFTPSQTRSNEAAAISGRIKEVRSSVTSLPPHYLKYMREFIDFVFPKLNILDPVDDDELYERQNRPTQRRLLELAGVEDNDHKIKSFMKKEAYQDIKDPRVISTYHPTIKAAYSKYIYAMANYVSKTKWYAFCKNPVEIADLVVAVCMNSKVGVAPTDLSRFDGRVSLAVRNFERLFLLAAFKKKYHDEIIELNRDQYNLTGYGALGEKYEQGPARGSGSAETALMNGSTNACMGYVAKRISRPDLTPQQVYNSLGVYGGDDGLTGDVDVQTYVKVAEGFGQKLEATLVRRGELGVNFLARIYTRDVWFGDNRSVCDIARQLSKLHATVSLPSNVTPEEKLIEKLRGFMFSDADTPVVGDMVERARTIGASLGINPKTVDIANFYTTVSMDNHFPNKNMHEFGMSILMQQVPSFNYGVFKTWLDGVKSVTDMLSPPLCATPSLITAVTRPTVVDGRLIRPKANPAADKRTARSAAGKPKRK